MFQNGSFLRRAKRFKLTRRLPAHAHPTDMASAYGSGYPGNPYAYYSAVAAAGYKAAPGYPSIPAAAYLPSLGQQYTSYSGAGGVKTDPWVPATSTPAYSSAGYASYIPPASAAAPPSSPLQTSAAGCPPPPLGAAQLGYLPQTGSGPSPAASSYHAAFQQPHPGSAYPSAHSHYSSQLQRLQAAQ